MKRYRCNHVVEAMRWDAGERTLLTAWHEKLTGKTPWFLDDGATVLVGDEWNTLKLGEWLLWSDGEFLVMSHEMFTAEYVADGATP